MVVADLHCHTTNSDGTLTLESLPAAAAAADLEAVAVTDHDRVHPGLAAPVVELGEGEQAVTVIHGIELRVEPGGGGGPGREIAVDGPDRGTAPDDEPDRDPVDDEPDRESAADEPDRGSAGERPGRDGEVAEDPGERVDLLGYGVRRTEALAELTGWVQAARVERGRAIVRRVEDRLGVDLGVTVEEGFGRPHVARAIEAHPGTDYDYQGAFDELIGNGGPCYVRRPVPGFRCGVRALRAACGLVGLAHPLRYDDPAAALALTADLDAVELHYPYGRPVDPAPVERAIREHGLLATGGSDAHDETLGVAGLDRDAYERVRAAIDRGGAGAGNA